MAQQTAVKWFYQRILSKYIKEVFEQAKAMENEQIEKAYIEGAEIAKEVLKEELREVLVFPNPYKK